MTQLSPTVVAVHTGPVTVGPLAALAPELLPGVRLVNLVDDSLLKDTMAAGAPTPAVIRRLSQYMLIGQDMGAELVLNCCSSVGEAAEVAARLLDIPVLKIDAAMAEAAVARARTIGVCATVRTTLDPTARLIERSAAAAGRKVSVVRRLCDGAFDALLANDGARHDAIVAEHLRALAAEVELIVLAQVSMARVADALGDALPCPVLSSPRLGLERVARHLAEAGRDTARPRAA
ncbi:MAG: Asp/Glu racemase [Gluconacetobacter diazotrophicus]|nr:Asp/Glu racemase [Gluconacetobacter diazotrophicus]